MQFMRRLIIMIGGRRDAMTPYTTFVDEESERLVEFVFASAAKAVESARQAKLKQHPYESDIIIALIDKLQDAGFG